MFENVDTQNQFEFLNTWNRIIHIPGVWKGPVQKLSVQHAEILIKQGRTDIRKKEQSQIEAFINN